LGFDGVSNKALPYLRFNHKRRRANLTRRKYCPSIEHSNRSARRAAVNGRAKTKPQIQENKAVPATPAIRPPISNPTRGMMGMFKNMAGRLMPL
jgi:hypothetical protein